MQHLAFVTRLALLFCCFNLVQSVDAQLFTDIPGPLGTLRCILPDSNGVWYLGSNSRGVLRSTDDGQSWSTVGGSSIMAGRINALIHYNGAGLMAATEQGGIKIWEGAGWSNLNTGLATGCGILTPVRALVLAPDGQVYAGAHQFAPCFTAGDLFRLEGTSWVSIAAGLPNANVNTLVIEPQSGLLYAGTDGGVFRRENNNWTPLLQNLPDTLVHQLKFDSDGALYACTNKGLAVLPAGQNSWQNLTNGNGWNGEPVWSVAPGPDPGHLLIGTGYDLGQPGAVYGHIQRSTDGGISWQSAAAGLTTTVVNDLHVAPGHTALAMGWGILRSGDGGQTWARSNTGFTGRAFNTHGRVAVSLSPHHTLFYGSDDGLFRSTDGGSTWEMADVGIERHIITLLKADHYGNLFCGAMRFLEDNGIGYGDGQLYKSTDDGLSWQPVVISKDWRYYEISEYKDGDMICAHGFGAQPPSATITGSSLARSTDHGDTWTDLNVQSGMAFCCTATASGDLFVAGESTSVYRSLDGGASFELVAAPGQSGNVGVLEASPTGEMLMSGGGQRTLFYSNDNGASYTYFNSTLLPDYRGVSDIIFDHNGKAYCTTNGTGGLPSLFTIDPPFSADAIFLGVNGVGGSLFKMTWDDCGYLYIYRAGGVLRSNDPLRLAEPGCAATGVGEVQNPASFEVYPNPVSGQLHIEVEHNGTQEAELLDVYGHLCKKADFQETLDWDMSDIPAGMYVVKLRDVASGRVTALKVVKGE